MFSYSVTCTFDTQAVADEWVAWLRDEHVADVMDAGALGAEVIQLDGVPLQCEVRYHFASREAFAAYERDHAPRLRAEGLARFGPDRGLQYARRTGQALFYRVAHDRAERQL